MNDLIIQGEPEMKRFTLTVAVTVGGAVVLPAGTVLVGRLEYLYPALDNEPTPLNKATLLSEQTEKLIWGEET